MDIDDATVHRIAHLARLELDPNAVPGLRQELVAILRWVEMLDEVDTEGVEPMTRVADMSLGMREDEVSDGGIADAVLANAPMSEDGWFVVPKVVE